MRRWLVELVGDAFFVEDIPYFFPSGPVRGLTEGGRHLLVADAFECESDAARVHELAQRLADDVTAALAVHLGHFPRPKTGIVYREDDTGNRTAHHFLDADPSVVRSKSRLGSESSQGPTYPQLFLKVAATSEHLHSAMRIWSDPKKTWPRLYRIMEEVQQHLGTAPNKAGLCTKTELQRFEHTANSAEASGEDSRHALRKYHPPSKPMTLAEASRFVGGVLHETLQRTVAAGAA